MLSKNAQETLKILATANGQTADAEDLKTQTGLSDSGLETAASELEEYGYAELLRGGELIGQPLRFYMAFITSRGTVAAGKL